MAHDHKFAPQDRPDPTPQELKRLIERLMSHGAEASGRLGHYHRACADRLYASVQAMAAFVAAGKLDQLVAAPARAHQEEKGNEMHDEEEGARGHTTGDPQSSRTAGKDGGSQNARAEQAFEEWWAREGRWIDPDTSDVPWFDKRKELCALAFIAATAQSRNYVADREVCPREVTFTNGRKVVFNDAWRCLDVELIDPHPAAAPDAGAPQEGAEPTPIHRSRTEEELIDALSTVCHFVWHRKLRPGEHLWSIPVDKERDFDCILSDGITELIELRRQLAAPVNRHVFTPEATGTACGLCGGWPDDSEHLAAPAVHQERTEPQLCCCEPAPDRSGRSCDKPRGHDGDHWTYGGNEKTWPNGAPARAAEQERTEPLTAGDLWAAARACDCQARIHNNAEAGRGKEWEALAAKVRRVAEQCGALTHPESPIRFAPARAAEWQPLTKENKDDQSRRVKPEIREPLQSSAAIDAGDDKDRAGTIDRCAQVAESMAAGPWGDPHDTITPGHLAVMIARAIRELK